MTNEDARIRLAEAMGWTNIRRESNAEFKDLGFYGIPPNNNYKQGLPNPFTNANDDYAVLNWAARGDKGLGFYERFVSAFNSIQEAELHQTCKTNIGYRIGDYARAALEELDNDSA